MYYGEPGRSLDRQTAFFQNSLPNWEFWLFQNYVGSGVCLFLDPLAGLSMKGFVQGLHLASLYPVRLLGRCCRGRTLNLRFSSFESG